MKNRYEIGSELREISPLVADIPCEGAPYLLPEGYFDTLADQILARVRAEGDHEVQKELQGLSQVVSQTPKTGIQEVPDGFFEAFPGLVMRRIQALESESAAEELQVLSPLLSGMEKKTPFTLPSDYFNELSGNLVAGMQAVDFVKDELEDLPASLAVLKGVNPYEVPQGYFEEFAGRMAGLLEHDRRRGRLVSMAPRRTWFKYAAAAMVAGLVFTAGLLYYHRPAAGNPEDPMAGLTKVSDQEILNYLQNEEIPLVSNSPLGSSTAIASVDEYSDSDMRDLMSDVSDNELQQYANDHMGLKDESTN